ncbi:MAG: MFS transporter [Gammaproteobacteria bacterium]
MARAQFSKNPAVDRALRHSVRDGMAYSVQVGAGETYFSAFALFLRASAPQIALISTLPQLLGSSANIFSAWAGQHFARRRLVIFGCAAQALLWIPIALVPVLVPSHAVTALLVLLALYYSANNLAAPQWTSIMRDLVSERRRGRYFGHRTRLTTIATFVSLVACGVLLHEVDKAGRTYFGFTLIFLVALVARVISVYHLTFLHEPPVHSPAPDMHIEQWWRSLKSTGALGFSTYVALMNAAVGLSSPFFTVYMLRDLQLSYLEFTVLSGASVFVQFLMLGTWGRVADVYGNRLVLIVTSISLPIVPAVWILSDDFWALLMFQALSGLSWSGFTLATGNLLYEVVPRTRRAAYVAFHNVGTAASVFAGAMLGAVLVQVLPPATVLLDAPRSRSNLLYIFVISGALRALVALFLRGRVRELRKPRREIAPHALVMRITGFNAMLGVIYDFIGRPPTETEVPDEPAVKDVSQRSRSGDNTP